MKKMYPDYNNCLVNLSNSILKYYGIKNNHSTLTELDKHLEKHYKNVVVILYDGFGSNLLAEKLGETAFLSKHKIKDITSVFPATTTAATTALITATIPAEHCWLGWDVYVKSINKTVTLYLNVEKGKQEQLSETGVAKREFPYISIFDKINESGNAKAYCVSPYDGGIFYNIERPEEMYNKLSELCSTDERKFIYAYYNEPDGAMHIHGTEDEKISELMKTIDKKTEEFCEKLSDTLVIITADHGHMTVGNYIVLADYPAIQSMLVRETSLEHRATNFFVKEGLQEKFRAEFMRLFGNDFILMSRQEIFESEIFGDGTPHEKFESCIGDFIAIAISDKAFIDEYDSEPLKGAHAGITEDEVKIPLIVVNRD